MRAKLLGIEYASQHINLNRMETDSVVGALKRIISILLTILTLHRYFNSSTRASSPYAVSMFMIPKETHKVRERGITIHQMGMSRHLFHTISLKLVTA